MSILFVLIPLAMLMLGAAVAAFFWAVGHAQFDDLETPGVRVLFDDAEVASQPGEPASVSAPPAPCSPTPIH